jgi:predicted ABC-type transport system involved in lysophospholipase L1 biosynthesis ATPase subunit
VRDPIPVYIHLLRAKDVIDRDYARELDVATLAREAEIVELLGELNADGSTLVVITHDAEVASAFRRQIRMRDGAIVSDARRPEAVSA